MNEGAAKGRGVRFGECSDLVADSGCQLGEIVLKLSQQILTLARFHKVAHNEEGIKEV